MINSVENWLFYFYSYAPLFQIAVYTYKTNNIFTAGKYSSGKKLRDRNEKPGEAFGQALCDR